MGLMDKANEFLNSEQGEQMSDQALQGAAGKANEMTGGKLADQISQGQQAADLRVGRLDVADATPEATAGTVAGETEPEQIAGDAANIGPGD